MNLSIFSKIKKCFLKNQKKLQVIPKLNDINQQDKENLQQYQNLIKQFSNDTINLIESQSNDDVSHISSYYFKMKSKLIRPQFIILLNLAINDNLKHNKNKAIEWARVVEIIHNSSLYHDDIFDKANTRRNQQSAHIKFGVQKASLTPIYLAGLNGNLIEQIGINELFNIYSTMIFDLNKGELIQQQLQKDKEKQQNIQDLFNLYCLKNYYKTATLFSNSALGIGIINQLDKEKQQKLFDFGFNIGMSFQFVDDILDCSKTAKLDKESCKDIKDGIFNLNFFIHQLQLSKVDSTNSNSFYDQFLKSNKTENEIQNIQNLLNNEKVMNSSKDYLNLYIKKSMQCLDDILNGQDNIYRYQLEKLLIYLIERTH